MKKDIYPTIIFRMMIFLFWSFVMLSFYSDKTEIMSSPRFLFLTFLFYGYSLGGDKLVHYLLGMKSYKNKPSNINSKNNSSPNKNAEEELFSKESSVKITINKILTNSSDSDNYLSGKFVFATFLILFLILFVGFYSAS